MQKAIRTQLYDSMERPSPAGCENESLWVKEVGLGSGRCQFNSPLPLRGFTAFTILENTLTCELQSVWGRSHLHPPAGLLHRTELSLDVCPGHRCDLGRQAARALPQPGPAAASPSQAAGRGLQGAARRSSAAPERRGCCGAGRQKHHWLLLWQCFQRRFWLPLHFARNPIMSACMACSQQAHRIEPAGPQQLRLERGQLGGSQGCAEPRPPNLPHTSGRVLNCPNHPPRQRLRCSCSAGLSRPPRHTGQGSRPASGRPRTTASCSAGAGRARRHR